jgi:hypothetical protein
LSAVLSRRFSVWRSIAALVPLLLVAANLPAEIMVRCHVDGLVRAAPCCDHPEERPDAGPAFKARDCCDRELTPTYRSVWEAVRAGDLDKIVPIALASHAAAGAAAAGPPAALRTAAMCGPPRAGPPIVLVKQAFLI